MNKFILLLSLFVLVYLHTSAQFTHDGRGMYVDKFFRTAINPAGSTVINPVFSILSIAAKEDSLLQYAKDNHITYLILYDVHLVLGNSTYENYLCSFMQKAKTQYCIEKFGAPSSCSSMFDNIAVMAPTPIFDFSERSHSKLINVDDQKKLDFVTKVHKPGDSLFYRAEVAKLGLRAMAFNDNCAYKFDVLVTEYEFWNSSTLDDCTGQSLTKDQKYVNYQGMINDMDLTRDNYNASHTHQIYVETYLGYLNQNTIYTHQAIANWIDGSYNGKRRVDRINLHYYGQNAATLYSRTASGQNYSGYYLTRFVDFNQSTTNNQTNYCPILSAEHVNWGAGASFLGAWFYQNVNNNVFTAEKYFYNDWYGDATTYSPATIGSPTLGSIVNPGSVVWFAASYMVGHLNKPVMFTSNSPVCAATGQNGTFQFQYQGPIEQGVSFKFYITDAGTSTLRCGTTNSITWPVYSGVTQTSIDLNAALNGCSLPAGEYDAHLELMYESGCSAYIAPLQRVSIVNTGKIAALTSTTACQGNPVYLQASSTGGGTTTYAWYDGASAISGATSSTFAPSSSVTGTHNYACRITSSIGACSANLSNVIPVTINPYPAASISGTTSAGCNLLLQASPSGGTYLWHNGSTASTYATTLAGSYSMAVTVNGCTSKAKYTYSKVDIDFVSKTGTCGGGPTGSITVNISNGVAPYLLSWSGPVNGNAAGLPAGNKTINNLSSGAYTIIVTDASGCTKSLSPNPVIGSGASISVTTTSIPASCSNTNNGSASITNVSGGSGGPYTYLWQYNNSTGSSLINIPAGSYVVNVFDASLCSTTSTVTVSAVNTSVIPSIAVSASPGNAVCTGTSVSFSAVPVNGGSTPAYQWRKNSSNVGTNSPTYTSSSLANGDIVYCILTSNANCASPASDTSNGIVMTVNSVIAPSVSITASPGNSICTGTNVTFTASPVNGGSTPSYQWKKNGVNIGTNSSSFSSASLINGDVITCVLTSNSSCASPLTAVSSGITMAVSVIGSPAVMISANTGTSICVGTNVTFSAAPFNGGTTPAYQWRKNGVDVGTNSSSYQVSTLLNGDVISCILTSNATCVSTTTATSNTLTMVINTNVVPTVNITSVPGSTICSGTNVTFTANTVNGGTAPSFQWKKNGSIVGSNSSTYADNSLVTNDAISCVLTSNASCASIFTASSNVITMFVNQSVVPTVSITANPGNVICQGTYITFNAVPVNGGTSPSYQWKKNGGNVGTNSSAFTTNTLVDGDVITCVLTSNAICASSLFITSNSITISTNFNGNASVSITANTGEVICEGTFVTFFANPVNGGNSPAYQWWKNGNQVGNNSGFYNDNNLLDGDLIRCEMSSNAYCVSSAAVSSNVLAMIVYQNGATALSISSNTSNTICEGTNVTFTAAPVNGGGSPFYQWKINGFNTGSNSNTYTSNTLSNQDVISCTLISSETCANPASAVSNEITMVVDPNIVPSISISANTGNSICTGTNVIFYAGETGGGANPVFQWKKNGSFVGFNSSTYSAGIILNNDQVQCEMISNANCALPINPSSNLITMNVSNIIVPAIAINSTSGSVLCPGVNETFYALSFGGGASPFYQWKVNGVYVGTNSSSYSSATLNNNDFIECEMTSSESCAAVNPVSSNGISVTMGACGLTLNLKVFIQGFYIGSGTMRAVADPIGNPTLCDTITVELHNASYPYNMVSTSREYIDIYGDGQFVFQNAILSESYYIVIRHRNTLEAWSKLPLLLNAPIMSYDFSLAASKAYGNNLADLGDGNFAIWSGDISNGIIPGAHDGIINNLDYITIKEAALQFQTGYIISDLNGDGVVESSDFSLEENNFGISVTLTRP